MGGDSVTPNGPLGPLGSSSSQHRRTLELILQEGSAWQIFDHSSQIFSCKTENCRLTETLAQPSQICEDP